jgi:hypothetical protein
MAIVALHWEGRRVAVPNPFTMEKSMSQISFQNPNRLTAFLNFYACPSMLIRGLKNQPDFRGFKVI